MTLPPPTKSHIPTPAPPRAAGPAAPWTGVGGPKGAARKGVPSPLRPNPQAGDGRYFIAFLRISAPPGATPTATSTCLCGRNRRAIGRRKVLDLIEDHTTHRDTCPLRTHQEGRTAA